MNARRSKWINFITAKNRAGRYLARLGTGRFTETPGIDDDVARSFLARLSNATSATDALMDAYDLLSNHYQHFVSRAERFVRSLNRDSALTRDITGPAIRGKALWADTIVWRQTRRLRTAQYLVRRPERSLSKPENVLVVSLLQDLLGSAARIRSLVGHKQLHRRIALIHSKCESALAFEPLRSIEGARWSAEEQLAATRRQRRTEYREALAIHEARSKLKRAVDERDIGVMLEFLRVGWYEPIDDNKLFELYCLVVVLDAIENGVGFGVPKEWGLTVGDKSFVAQYCSENGISVDVRFQQSPVTAWSATSRYLAIVNSYAGLSGSACIPDIALRVQGANFSRYFFVECKNSSSRGYLTEGVYEVLGYLADFAVWPRNEPGVPKALLMIPEQTALRPGQTGDDSVFVASADDTVAIAGVLQRLVTPPYSS